MLPDTPRIQSRLDLLYLVTREFNTGLDIDVVLNRVLTATVASVGASDASLSLFNNKRELELFIPITGFQMQQINPTTVAAIHERGLVSWVKNHREAILIKDISHDERWYHKKTDTQLLNEGSAIAVPIQSPDQFVGVLTITAAKPNYFDDSDLAMLTIIADQAAFAILNARLFEAEQHRRQLADILASIARTINSTLDLKEVLDLILKHLALVIEYDSSSIFLYDEKEKVLSVQAAQGFEDMTDALSVVLPEANGGPHYTALYHKTPIVIREVDEDPSWIKSSSSQNIHSWIGAPLIAQDKVIGLLTIDSNQVGKYNSENAKEVAAFADQAATAVANAQPVSRLQSTEASYMALFEHSTDVIIITSYQGTILNLNNKARQILLRSRDEIIGRNISEVNPQLKDYLVEHSHELQAQKEVSFEVEVYDANENSIPLELQGQQVHYSGTNCVQWTGRDISARKEAEKMRQDLVNMLVHDLRGPVGNLINVIEMLPMLIDVENESFHNILEMAHRSGQEVRDLIDSMLDVGLLEQGEIPLQRNPVILDDMVSAVQDQVEPRANAKETSVAFAPLPATPVLFIDGGMIRRVLINLVDNGIKYTPNGGNINVITKLIDNTLHFTVSDNGPGIPKLDQAHIFEKFSRVDHASKISGVGLGLAFCKLAVEAHGGTIRVESEGIPGQGSTFYITVPIGSEEDMF